ncbi:MAG: YifB family Mg chelatase-like AAA ATPase [Candidatus Omnitrophica bacterium]|nr:YifB family Mg chelatase-like AAA ATPase [Candidatus Omnitrophota bacterium]
MVTHVLSFAVHGIEAYLIDVEIDISNGLPSTTVVGLPDAATKESKERVRSAIKNSGFDWPQERITISLAPAHLRKEGASFDLAIAIGILAATEQISLEHLARFCILGELALDGSTRPIQGALPIGLALVQSEIKKMILPQWNAKEASLVSGINLWPVKSLKETVELLSNPDFYPPFSIEPQNLLQKQPSYNVDYSEVKGQYFAKRALEVAVAGGHNILMIGPPGSGKTMLAKRIPTIMPDLTLPEALEVTKIHSVAGTLSSQDGMVATRPFRSLHHTISDVALVGGGTIPKPGEISLAHQGVLFLDELPEFHRSALESLRQPLEEGIIRVSRIHKSLVFPASCMLVCAMNPCPCGYYTDPRKACHCNPGKIAGYLGKISGPLLDRIDIHIELPAIRYQELVETKNMESSEAIKARVEKAREIQRNRFKDENIFCNAQMNTTMIKRYCALDTQAKSLLKVALTKLGFSARAYDKVLKVGRTVADLANNEIITVAHIAEAIQYRSLDK